MSVAHKDARIGYLVDTVLVFNIPKSTMTVDVVIAIRDACLVIHDRNDEAWVVDYELLIAAAAAGKRITRAQDGAWKATEAQLSVCPDPDLLAAKRRSAMGAHASGQ